MLTEIEFKRTVYKPARDQFNYKSKLKRRRIMQQYVKNASSYFE